MRNVGNFTLGDAVIYGKPGTEFVTPRIAVFLINYLNPLIFPSDLSVKVKARNSSIAGRRKFGQTAKTSRRDLLYRFSVGEMKAIGRARGRSGRSKCGGAPGPAPLGLALARNSVTRSSHLTSLGRNRRYPYNRCYRVYSLSLCAVSMRGSLVF